MGSESICLNISAKKIDTTESSVLPKSMSNFLTHKLGCLIEMDMESVRSMRRSRFAQLTGPHEKKIVLFGAGNLGRKVLNSLRNHGIEPLAFADNNQSMQNTIVDGIPVFGLTDAVSRFKENAVFVVTIWNYKFTYLHAKRQLEGLGCKSIVHFLPLMWKYPEELLPHYCNDLPESIIAEKQMVRKAFECWKDDISRNIFLSFLEQRLWANFEILPPPTDFFPRDVFELCDDEVFVDAGAYDGDTIVDFMSRVKNFKRIIAVEPDPSNHEKLCARISQLPSGVASRITPLRVALGARREMARFHATGTMGSAIGHHGEKSVECVPLDEVFIQEPPTYVKLDIEGGEMDALKGSQRLIREAATIWGVTTEHRMTDLWRIPLFFRSLSNDYDFFLRCHGYEGVDLICYAVPLNRSFAKNES
jgi:FkbM family methyltransferase